MREPGSNDLMIAQLPQPRDGGHAFDEPAAGTFDVRDVLLVLRRNVWTILLLGLLGVTGVYALLSREQARYRAEALIRLRDSQAEVIGDLVSEGDAQKEPAISSLSELMVLKGRLVAGNVVDREGLRLFNPQLRSPSIIASQVDISLPPDANRQLTLTFGQSNVSARMDAARAIASYGAPLVLPGISLRVAAAPHEPTRSLQVVPREDAIDWVLHALSAHPNEGTDAITVAVTSPSPALSIRVANAVIDAYQLASAKRVSEASQRQRQYLEARLREIDDSLVTAQTALGHFRARTGVVSARAQSDAELAGASTLDRQRQQLEAEQRIRRRQLADLESAEHPTQSPAFQALLASPEIAASPFVARLYQRFVELQTKRDELLAAGRPPGHADVVELQRLSAPIERQLLDAIRSQVRILDSRVAALGDARQQATAEVGRLTPSEAEEIRLNEQVDAMHSLGALVRNQLQRLRLEQAAEMGQVEVVDRATRALRQPSRRSTKLALGLAFGIFLGVAIGFIRDNLDSALHRRTELEQILRVPGLVVIPQFSRAPRRNRLLGPRTDGVNAFRPTRGRSRTGHRGRPELVTVSGSSDSAASAYRALRTRLLFSRSGAGLRTLAVTSTWAGEGKTTTAANLSVTLAQQGLRVLLIDCDLHHSSLHRIFGLPNDIGLADVLLSDAPLSSALQDTGITGLSLLSSGSTGSGVGASELLGSRPMAELIRSASEQFDITLLDSPPVLLAPDASVIAARSDGTLLVLRAGRTRRALVQDALQQLAAVGARIVGAVLNDADAKTPLYREYKEQYLYQYEQ